MEEEYKGIRCPQCGVVDDYKGGPNKKEQGMIKRRKTCNQCKTEFETIEVYLGLYEKGKRK